MDEIAKNTASDSAMDAGTWIIRLLIAVILGEGIWGLIVSLTHNLILPLLAKTMGGDVQSPLYLGKGDVNVPALFTSLLELCFAGIVAVVLNAWVQREARSIRGKSVRVTPRPVEPAASTPASAVTPVKPTAFAPVEVKQVPGPAARTPIASVPAVPTPSIPSPSPEQFWSPPEPSPQPKPAAAPPSPKPPAKPAKPKPPKEVYYNIVGEPINPTEDE